MKTFFKVVGCVIIEWLFAIPIMVGTGALNHRGLMGEIIYPKTLYGIGEAVFFPSLVMLSLGLIFFLKSDKASKTIKRFFKKIASWFTDPSSRNDAVKEYEKEVKEKIDNGLFVVASGLIGLAMAGILVGLSYLIK